MKRVVFGLCAAFFLAAFSPSSAEAQFDPCDACDHSWGFAACVLGGGGPIEGCFADTPLFCSGSGSCEGAEDQDYAVDLTGTAVDPNADDTKILTAGILTRPCDFAITARVLSETEARQHRRELRTLVI